jgi:hypothetical protein
MHFTAEIHSVAETHSTVVASQAANMDSLVDTPVHSAASTTVAPSEAIPLAATRAWEASTAGAAADSMAEEAAFTAEVEAMAEGIGNTAFRYCNATYQMEK